MPKTMAPFPTLPPRPCRLSDCSSTCTNPEHKADDSGRHVFNPRTPWQEDCSDKCRNRWNYLNKVKPARAAAREKKKSEESGAENSNQT